MPRLSPCSGSRKRSCKRKTRCSWKKSKGCRVKKSYKKSKKSSAKRRGSIRGCMRGKDKKGLSSSEQHTLAGVRAILKAAGVVEDEGDEFYTAGSRSGTSASGSGSAASGSGETYSGLDYGERYSGRKPLRPLFATSSSAPDYGSALGRLFETPPGSAASRSGAGTGRAGSGRFSGSGSMGYSSAATEPY